MPIALLISCVILMVSKRVWVFLLLAVIIAAGTALAPTILKERRSDRRSACDTLGSDQRAIARLQSPMGAQPANYRMKPPVGVRAGARSSPHAPTAAYEERYAH